MYDFKVHSKIENLFADQFPQGCIESKLFFSRLIANASSVHSLFYELYGKHIDADLSFDKLLETIVAAFKGRCPQLRQEDIHKLQKGNWFLSNKLAGMSLYVDRFCGCIANLEEKIDLFQGTWCKCVAPYAAV